jgi:hypothetical protein
MQLAEVASQTSERPFQFSTISLTDDDELACTDEAVVKNMGTIQIKLWRVQVLGAAKPFIASPIESKTLHERSKKAQLSHQTTYLFFSAYPFENGRADQKLFSLGPPRQIKQNFRSSFHFIDPRDTPLVVCEFRYRSRGESPSGSTCEVRN